MSRGVETSPILLFDSPIAAKTLSPLLLSSDSESGSVKRFSRRVSSLSSTHPLLTSPTPLKSFAHPIVNLPSLTNNDVSNKAPRLSSKKNKAIDQEKRKAELLLKKERTMISTKNKEFLKLSRRKRTSSEKLEEMLVVLDSGFDMTVEGRQILKTLSDHGVHLRLKACPHSQMMLFYHITYDVVENSTGYLGPCARLVHCPTIMLRYTSSEFFRMIHSRQIHVHFKSFVSSVSSRTKPRFIVLIEGLSSEYRRQKTTTNRDFVRQVRDTRINDIEHANDQTISSAKVKKRKPKKKTSSLHEDVVPEMAPPVDETPIPSKKELESIFLFLQSEYRMHILLTKNSHETSEWLLALLRTMSENDLQNQGASSSYYSETGKAATGCSSAWQQMLEQLHHITPQTSQTIVQSYPTIHSFMQMLKTDNPVEYLSHLKINDQRTLGPAIAKRLYAFFTCQDPSMFIC